MVGRNWKLYPKRLREEASATSGVVGLASLGLTAAGGFLALPVIGGIGLTLLVGSAGWTFIKALPPKLILAESLLHTHFYNLKVLDDIQPTLPKVGLIGLSRSGKSTLIDALQIKRPRQERTEILYATVASLPVSPVRYYALIDAAGQQMSQQFGILDHADIVVIILDHNMSDYDGTRQDSRLIDHDRFLDQVGGHFNSRGRLPRRIHFLLNKRDLWMDDANGVIEGWFEQHVTRWSQIPTVTVSSAIHSNLSSDDIALLVSRLHDMML